MQNILKSSRWMPGGKAATAREHRVARDVKSARRLREPVAPLPSLPPRQAKETSHRVRPRLLSVDDFKISNEKHCWVLSLSQALRSNCVLESDHRTSEISRLTHLMFSLEESPRKAGDSWNSPGVPEIKESNRSASHPELYIVGQGLQRD
ncbi:hypothetical protein Q9233_005577 [Columba guinea]|nr:hypothetical protein Q9233_005577 [Columba guinea]